MKIDFLFLIVCLLLAQNASANKIKASVIYGNDDRYDYYEMHDPIYLNAASASIAILYKDKLLDQDNGLTKIVTTKYGEDENLCPEERFYDQPTAVDCSGVLIAPNIVLTAGHCFNNLKDCNNSKFIFGFAITKKSVFPEQIPNSEIYSCVDFIKRVNKNDKDDFALVRLDREVTNHKPTNFNIYDTIITHDTVFAVGYPRGIPLKFAINGRVRNVEDFSFNASIDTYEANSGSPVFNQKTGLLEGILLSGDDDFIYDKTRSCNLSNRCAEDDCSGESIIKISAILPYLPKIAK